MKHLGTCQLQTERLVLRRFKTSDAEMVYKNWTSDKKVTRYVLWDTHMNVQMTRAVLSGWVEAYKDLETYQWAIVNKENDQVIGSISLFDFKVLPGEEEAISAEMGYCMSRSYWGKGLITEAARIVLVFAFECVKLRQVRACHDVRNPASGRVMQKIGMHYDGLIKKAMKGKRRRWLDCKYYSLQQEKFLG